MGKWALIVALAIFLVAFVPMTARADIVYGPPIVYKNGQKWQGFAHNSFGAGLYSLTVTTTSPNMLADSNGTAVLFLGANEGSSAGCFPDWVRANGVGGINYTVVNRTWSNVGLFAVFWQIAYVIHPVPASNFTSVHFPSCNSDGHMQDLYASIVVYQGVSSVTVPSFDYSTQFKIGHTIKFDFPPYPLVGVSPDYSAQSWYASNAFTYTGVNNGECCDNPQNFHYFEYQQPNNNYNVIAFDTHGSTSANYTQTASYPASFSTIFTLVRLNGIAGAFVPGPFLTDLWGWFLLVMWAVLLTTGLSFAWRLKRWRESRGGGL